MSSSVSRRTALGALTAGATAALLESPVGAAASAGAAKRATLVARPPAGFTPLSVPGKVVKVTRPNSLQANGLWPTEQAASELLTRAMTELTGKPDLGSAFGRYVHKDDIVAIKPNGLAGKRGATMASNKELVLEIVKGVMAAGVPADHITIYEQFYDFLAGTRCADKTGAIDPAFPAGVKTAVHSNKDAPMDEVQVYGRATRYVRPFMEATAVINVSLIKDHSICGYTGALKNITHGSIVNPHHYHEHLASPQIAELYAQDLVRSRVRLHVVDGMKVVYEGGPHDHPSRRVKHEAVYVSTDPVALDMLGAELVDKLRAEAKLPDLKSAGRDPSYIRAAGMLGLGMHEREWISLREVTLSG